MISAARILCDQYVILWIIFLFVIKLPLVLSNISATWNPRKLDRPATTRCGSSSKCCPCYFQATHRNPHRLIYTLEKKFSINIFKRLSRFLCTVWYLIFFYKHDKDLPKDFPGLIRTQSAELPARPCIKSIGVFVLDFVSCSSSRPRGIRCSWST